jgi:4-hydroxy-3-polyprenylbenzoate decarboxylase
VSGRPRRLIVAITGASGAVYGVRMVRMLAETDVETHLVVSKHAMLTLRTETDWTVRRLRELVAHCHSPGDVGASIASGSYRCDGMLVAPCSIKTLSAIVTSHAEDLVARAADVTLKEGRKLVLLVREAPLHLGHLRLMTSAAEIGATIMPPVPAFYQKPRTIEDIVDQTVARALDQVGVDVPVTRWAGLAGGQVRGSAAFAGPHLVEATDA